MSASVSVAVSGLLAGFAAGFLVARSRLCTFGALEDFWMGGDTRRLKVFGLALALALLFTQPLLLSGLLDPDRITYLPSRLPILGVALGGLMFGIGMAFVGTCGFGSLVRLGSGDLRAIVTLLVMAVTAYAALRGGLSAFRIGVLERVAVPFPGPSRAELGAQMLRLTGQDFASVVTPAIVLALLGWLVADRRLWRAPRLLMAGIGLGLAVAFGWFATAAFSDPFDAHQRPQSLTFVAPIARAVLGVLAGQDSPFDFGVASVAGVVLGALAANLAARDFRWEAFDDPREMRRHLGGATLMGLGGVLAGGCTIGQGLTAGSVLALSMPVAIAAMAIGARLGIAILVGEIADRWASFRSRG